MREGLCRVTVVAVGCALVVLLSGCGAGQLAQTAAQVTMTNGADGRVGSIALRDAQFGADGRPVAGDAIYQPGQDVSLQLTIVNDAAGAVPGVVEPDRLVEVQSPIARSARVAGDTRVAAGEALVAGYDRPVASVTVPGAREIEISLLGLTEPLRAAMTYPVEFTFARAGSLVLELPVENPQFVKPRAQDPPIYPRPEVGDVPGKPLTPLIPPVTPNIPPADPPFPPAVGEIGATGSPVARSAPLTSSPPRSACSATGGGSTCRSSSAPSPVRDDRRGPGAGTGR